MKNKTLNVKQRHTIPRREDGLFEYELDGLEEYANDVVEELLSRYSDVDYHDLQISFEKMFAYRFAMGMLNEDILRKEQENENDDSRG